MLTPFGRLVEVPVMIMAAAGIVLMCRHRTALLDRPGMRVFALVFAAMWLPILISLPDAVNPQRTAVVVVNHLRFAASGVFMIWVLVSSQARDRLLTLLGALLAFWVVDAGVQMVLGVDLLGLEPVAGNRISGPFGHESLKLGTTLGVIAPLLWVCVQRRFSPWVLAATMLATAFIVMAATARAGWVSLLVCACAFGWINRDYVRRLGARMLVPAVLFAALLPLVAYHTLPAFKIRFDTSISELTGRQAVESSPLGHRAYILEGAVSMIEAHPVNGVGARGFRYAFPHYAAPDDPFVAQTPPLYPTHSHQLLFEVTAETGVIGLAGLLFAAWLLARAAYRAPQGVRADITPYGIALCAAFFPLNTHLAIYGAHYSQLVWWLIGLYCACLDPPGGRSGTAPARG